MALVIMVCTLSSITGTANEEVSLCKPLCLHVSHLRRGFLTNNWRVMVHRPDSMPDTRALWLHRLTSWPVSRLVGLVHGALLPLHDLLNAAAAGEPIGQGPDIGELSISIYAFM